MVFSLHGGSNFSGQLGSPDYKNFHLPVIVRMKNGEILKDIIKVAAGWDFSVALKKDGTVWAWGDNQFGQLGDGIFISKKISCKSKKFFW